MPVASRASQPRARKRAKASSTPKAKVATARVQEAASRLGIEDLHPEQKQVIDDVLQGRDVVMIVPTGFGKSACYQIPSMVLPKPVVVISPLLALMEDTDCVLVDGTFWCEDEMARAGVGTKLASDMGHLPQSGEDGMLAWLRRLRRPRKILIHINNTNPILIEDSPERSRVEADGVEVASDGLEFEVAATEPVGA